MAAIEELVRSIADTRLRDALAAEVARLKATKKFGLVFEEHLPETVLLPGLAIKVGTRVMLKNDPHNLAFRVIEEVNGKRVKVVPDHATKSGVIRGLTESIVNAAVVMNRSDLVVAKAFGEPMYPALIPIDAVERAPGKPWHVLISADNYHALQLLQYGYQGKVDLIYIDPPYNSGARDWKYNNNYIDGNDLWRHSKWLSMMKKRLQLARQLLRPDDGVLIVTIDEHEVHHLGLLLGELLPNYYRQMVTIIINPKGVTQGRFSRVEEYAFFCFGPKASVTGRGDDLLTPEVEENGDAAPRWKGLLRSGTNAARKDRKNMYYPILIDSGRGAVVGTGDPLPFDKNAPIGKKIDGYDAVWPVRADGSEGNWGVGHTTLRQLIAKGYVALGGYNEARKTWGITYLSRKLQTQIAGGAIEIVRFDKVRNVVEIRYAEMASRQIKAVWHRTSHDAGAYGSDLLREMLGRGRTFSFPKSVYAVRDSLAAIVRDRKDAIIVDFFAGSATTANATAMVNAEDGGRRRCILVTNNEVSEQTARELLEQGVQPDSKQWEREGIAEAVTWPRVMACLTGRRPDGSKILGEYLDGRPLADGFEENAAYFRLDFLDPDEVSRGEQFEAVIPILWMLAGSVGACAISKGGGKWFIPSGNRFAVLMKEDCFAGFREELVKRDDITHVFLVTDSAEAFNDMSAVLGSPYICLQLYRSYIDTFRINLSEPGTRGAADYEPVPTFAEEGA